MQYFQGALQYLLMNYTHISLQDVLFSFLYQCVGEIRQLRTLGFEERLFDEAPLPREFRVTVSLGVDVELYRIYLVPMSRGESTLSVVLSTCRSSMSTFVQ